MERDDGRVARARLLAQQSVDLHWAKKYDAADDTLAEAQDLDPPRHVAPVKDIPFERQEWEHLLPGEPGWGSVNLVNYARRQPDEQQVFADYYTMEIDEGISIEGQRKPGDRIDRLPRDLFAGASVLDIGCNTGAMLHAACRLGARWGVGTDYDHRVVNAANRVAAGNPLLHDLRFYVHDLDRDPLSLLHDYLPESEADIILLLAVCAHVRGWRSLIAKCSEMAKTMVLEANGSEPERLGQLRAAQRGYDEILELSPKGPASRRLYLCTR